MIKWPEHLWWKNTFNITGFSYIWAGKTKVMEQLDYSIFPERTVEYASFWSRVGASLIDSLVMAIPQGIITLMFSKDVSAGYLINIVLSWLYCSLQESGPGMATVGKRAMGIKVTNLEGERITFGQATGRHFAKLLSTLILAIGYLMMLWNERRQTLHDQIAGTLVVLN